MGQRASGLRHTRSVMGESASRKASSEYRCRLVKDDWTSGCKHTGRAAWELSSWAELRTANILGEGVGRRSWRKEPWVGLKGESSGFLSAMHGRFSALVSRGGGC